MSKQNFKTATVVGIWNKNTLSSKHKLKFTLIDSWNWRMFISQVNFVQTFIIILYFYLNLHAKLRRINVACVLACVPWAFWDKVSLKAETGEVNTLHSQFMCKMQIIPTLERYYHASSVVQDEHSPSLWSTSALMYVEYWEKEIF